MFEKLEYCGILYVENSIILDTFRRMKNPVGKVLHYNVSTLKVFGNNVQIVRKKDVK